MKTQTSKTAAVMGLISRGPTSAPSPAAGDAATQPERTIDEITADILRAQVDGGRAVLTIGNGLIEAKGKLNHGEWLPWLTENVGYSEKKAENYMRIARNYSNPQLVADLGLRKALSLLALPEGDRENFVDEANVVDMTSRELEKAVRERAEALEAKEQAEAALARAVEEAGRAAADSIAARKELDELKARPVEVAVMEADTAEIEKARAEAVAAMQKKLDKADKARKTAEDDLAAAKAELMAARKQLASPAKPEEPSPLASDVDLAQFKLLFDQAQTIVNRMRGLLLKARSREDSTVAEKLEAALTALSDKVRGCAA